MYISAELELSEIGKQLEDITESMIKQEDSQAEDEIDTSLLKVRGFHSHQYNKNIPHP